VTESTVTIKNSLSSRYISGYSRLKNTERRDGKASC
jgi:hypothetical protein